MSSASPAGPQLRARRSENVWVALRGRLSPSRAVQHAIRFGTAASFALWLAYAVNLPKPTWPLVTVLMVAQPAVGASVQKGILRMVGTLMAAVAGITIYGAFAQNHLLLAIATSLIYAIAVYGKDAARHGYAWQAFGFTTGVIIGGTTSGTNPIEIVAFDRVSLVLLGILASFAAEAIFWPVRTEPTLRADLAARLEALADAMSRWKSARLGTPQPSDSPPDVDPSRLLDQLGQIDQLRSELGVDHSRARAYTTLALDTEAISSCIRALDADGSTPDLPVPTPLQAPLETVLSQLITALRGLQRWLEEGRSPEPAADALREAMRSFEDARLTHLATQIGRAREEEGRLMHDSDARTAALLRQISSPISRAIDSVAEIESALARIERDDAPAKRAAPPARPRSFSFSIDRLRLELAMRAGLAVGSVWIVMPLLGWQVNATVMTMAFLAASMPTRTAVNRVVIAIVVAALGSWLIADLSIVYLVPHMGRMPGALFYPMIVAGLAGYAIVRFPKIGVLAPSVAVIAILSVFGGASPPTNVQGPYLTTMILFIGIAIGVAAQRLLWPRTAGEIFLIRGAGLLEVCMGLLSTASAPAMGDDGRALDEASALTESTRQVALMTEMHAQAEIEPVADALDGASRAQLMATLEEVFQASLSTGSLAEGAFPAVLADGTTELAPLRSALAAQDDMILRSLRTSIACLKQQATSASTGLLDAQEGVEDRIEALRSRSGSIEALGGREVDTLLAYIEGRRRLAARVRGVEQWLEDWQAAKKRAE